MQALSPRKLDHRETHSTLIHASLDRAMEKRSTMASTLSTLRGLFGDRLNDENDSSRYWIKKQISLGARKINDSLTASDGLALADFAVLMKKNDVVNTQ